MNKMITYELREEHAKIQAYFNQIDVASDNETRKALVMALKDLIAVHVKKEDSILYPALRSSKNEEIVNLGNTFLNSMVGYSATFADVTTLLLECNDKPTPELWAEYERMRDKIKNRIFVEEVALFPAYERFV